MGKVWAVHVDGGDPALFSQSAFENVWQPRSWQLVAPDLGAAHEAGYLVEDEGDLPISYIREVLAGRASAAEPEPAPTASNSKKKSSATTPAVSENDTTGGAQ